MTDPLARLRAAILSPGFVRATFAGTPRSGPCPWVRVVVRPVELRGELTWQFAYFDGKKTATHNHVHPSEPLDAVLAFRFGGMHVTTTTEELDVRVTKKGAVTLGVRKVEIEATVQSHNRIKDVPLPEGRADRVLEVMGIMTAQGQVRPTMRGKYTQINEFLKHLEHTLDAAGLRKLGRPLQILDCGCGASYLTIATHHYLNDILGLPTKIVGVDVREDVIRKSVERAKTLDATNLNFACERIGEANIQADIVIALHACDTATDDALAQAVRSEAKLILSVPCCHHALNAELRSPETAWNAVLKHGILRERTADILTDAFRATALRIMGFKTDVVEFVSLEHTARNLMIRATASRTPDTTAVAEYLALKQFWGVAPVIEAKLGAAFKQRLLK
jgi:SAM-dependent methyltransferase